MQDIPAFTNEHLSRTYPSAQHRSPAEQKLLTSQLGVLRKMLQPTPACHVVRAVEDLLATKKSGYTHIDEDDLSSLRRDAGNLFIKERDHQAFAVIRPGTPEWKLADGLNIIVAHCDIPLLRVRDLPTYVDWDPEKKFSHPGAYLELRQYGGLHAPDWTGISGHIQGVVAGRGGRMLDVNIPAQISSSSIHLENEYEEATSFDAVRAFTGASGRGELLKQLRVPAERDLAAAELYFRPTVHFQTLNNRFTVAYGLDDRACMTAALLASMNASPTRPTLFFGLNCEETYSLGRAGKVNGFFSNVVGSYIGRRTGRRPISIQELDSAGAFRYPAICADVSALPSHNEIAKPGAVVVPLESSRCGFGPAVVNSWGAGANHNPPIYNRILQDALRNGGKGLYQIVGTEFKANEANEEYISHFAQYFTDSGIPMIAVGTPVQSLHRPGGEMMHNWDWHETIIAYKRWMEFSFDPAAYRHTTRKK